MPNIAPMAPSTLCVGNATGAHVVQPALDDIVQAGTRASLSKPSYTSGDIDTIASRPFFVTKSGLRETWWKCATSYLVGAM